MEQIADKVKSLVNGNNNEVYSLSSQMGQLEVVQGAVARLLERIEEITHKGWHKNSGMAYMSILEIQDTVCLINMAFHPLFKEMLEGINTLKIHADELDKTVLKNESEQSNRPTTQEVEICGAHNNEPCEMHFHM